MLIVYGINLNTLFNIIICVERCKWNLQLVVLTIIESELL